MFFFFFFFNDTATTEIYTVSDTLSLHDALPIPAQRPPPLMQSLLFLAQSVSQPQRRDRKSTRLNSSHLTQSRMPSSACKKKNHSRLRERREQFRVPLFTTIHTV